RERGQAPPKERAVGWRGLSRTTTMPLSLSRRLPQVSTPIALGELNIDADARQGKDVKATALAIPVRADPKVVPCEDEVQGHGRVAHLGYQSFHVHSPPPARADWASATMLRNLTGTPSGVSTVSGITASGPRPKMTETAATITSSLSRSRPFSCSAFSRRAQHSR